MADCSELDTRFSSFDFAWRLHGYTSYPPDTAAGVLIFLPLPQKQAPPKAQGLMLLILQALWNFTMWKFHKYDGNDNSLTCNRLWSFGHACFSMFLHVSPCFSMFLRTFPKPLQADLMTGLGPGSTRSQSFSMCLLSSVMLLWVRICHNTCALHVLHFAPFSRAVSDIWWLLWAVFNWSNWIMHLLHNLLLADLHSFLAEIVLLLVSFWLVPA